MHAEPDNVVGLPVHSAPDELVTRRGLAGAMLCSVSHVDRLKAAGMPFVPYGRQMIRFRLREAMAWAENYGREQRRAA